MLGFIIQVYIYAIEVQDYLNQHEKLHPKFDKDKNSIVKLNLLIIIIFSTIYIQNRLYRLFPAVDLTIKLVGVDKGGRGGGTVGQFGPSGCRIKSTSIFVIFSNEGWCSSISSVMTGHQNDNNFVLTPLHDGPRSGRRGPFLAKNLLFSTLRLYNPHFLVSDGPD